jgi:hypothetical protein
MGEDERENRRAEIVLTGGVESYRRLAENRRAGIYGPVYIRFTTGK